MNALHAAVFVVAEKLGELGRAAHRVDQFGISHAPLNTTFRRDVNTALINKAFVQRKLPPMHPSAKRLLDKARSATNASATPITSFGDLVARMGVSSATMTNWKARGVSKDGVLQAEALFGGSASELLTGEMPAQPAAAQPTRTPEADDLATLCDAIPDDDERDRFIATARHYAGLAATGRLSAVLDGLQLASPATEPKLALPPAGTSQTAVGPAAQTSLLGAARSKR